MWTLRDDESIPDHSTLAKHAVDVPDEWMDAVQVETARRLAEAARSTVPIANSNATETTKHETVEKSNIKERDVVETHQKTC